MNNQKGFTLIELIVVIVILGILSAVAVPKFVDMQGEAKKGVLDGIRGSLKSAVMMAHGKALVSGKPDETIKVEGLDVTMSNSYPDATELNLERLVDLDGLTVASATDDDFIAAVTAADAATSTSAFITVTYGTNFFTYTETTSKDIPPETTRVE